MLNYRHPETIRIAGELSNLIANHLTGGESEMIIDLHDIETSQLPNENYPTIKGKMVSIEKDGTILQLDFKMSGNKLFDKAIKIVKG